MTRKIEMRAVTAWLLFLWGHILTAGEINTDLLAAVQAGNAAQVRALVEKGYLVVSKRESGEAALRFCAAIGDTASMKALLQHHCDPDAVTKKGDHAGWTALVHAIVNGHADAVRLLLTAGADPEIKPESGTWKDQSPLLIAVQMRRLDMVRLLLDAGARRHRRSGKKRVTPLMMAAENGDMAMLALFLDGESNPDRTDRNGWTALFYAVKSGCLPCIQALVEAGADVNRRDRDHVSILQYAGHYVTRLRNSEHPPADLERILPWLRSHAAR